MLEHSMVVSRLEPRSRLVLLSVAAALHAAVLTAAMVAAVWNVSLPSTPPAMRELWVPARAVALPPPPPPPPAAASAAQRSEPAVEHLTPVTTPVETRVEELPSQSAGPVSETGSQDGQVGGQDGGVRDGVIGSVVDSPVTHHQPVPPVLPVRPGGGVSTPVNVVRIEPTYPELAKKIGAQGLVVIECVIASDGSVRDPKIVRGAHPLLDKAALEAVRQWKFAPGRMGERPVDVLFTLTVRFELAGGR